MTDLTFVEGQPWQILFSAHDEEGGILPLTSGAEVELKINAITTTGSDNVLSIGMNNGVVITDPMGGIATITISEEAQAALDPPMSSDSIYFYEIRVHIGGVPEKQAEGRLYIDNSMFADPTANAWLEQFRAKFPELDSTLSGVVAANINEAVMVVNANVPLANSNVSVLATLYYAAHLIVTGKRAAAIADSGGVDLTGQVKSITVEDRTVTFATPGSSNNSGTGSSSLSGQGLNGTIYGQRYLALLRLFPQFIARA